MAETPEKKPRTRTSGSMMDLFKAVGEAATVVTGLSFIGGWLYWSTYYSTFGLNALELDFSVAVLSVSPIQVLLRDWQSEGELIGTRLILAAIAGLLLTGFFVHFRLGGYRRAGAMLGLIAFGMCWGAYGLGRHDGILDLGCHSRLPDVAFVSNMPLLTPGDGAADCVANGTLSCKLVLHSNAIYHYFPTPDPSSCQNEALEPGTGVASAEIPDSQVRMVRVHRLAAW